MVVAMTNERSREDHGAFGRLPTADCLSNFTHFTLAPFRYQTQYHFPEVYANSALTQSRPEFCVTNLFSWSRASNDNIRLWNANDTGFEAESAGRSRSGVPFKIIPGHHGGIVSQMCE